MKRITALLLTAVICAAVFGGCSKKAVIVEDRKLKPTEPIKAEDLLPEEEFLGTFVNDDYIMVIEQTDNDRIHITVKSAVKDKIGYEWDIYSIFSNSTYRINYTDAVKTVVNYDKNGKETSRENEYENGVGRIQFSDSNTLKWENSMDSLSNTVFERK